MKVGIIGYGFVGKSLSNGLNDDLEVFKVDPQINTSIVDLKIFNPEVIFICVPTPMNNDGDQDLSILRKVIEELKENKIESLIVLKSTVHPGHISEIESLFSSFVYNPEFLREKYAYEDFINSTLIIFGGDKKSSKLLGDFYTSSTKCINTDYIYTDSISASLIKYAINSYLASKVIFFNEFNNLFNSVNKNESWSNFISYLSKDPRIGESHMNVPGHDGRYGFGGACFPKDTSAITKFADKFDVELSMIKNAIKVNNKIRASYKDTTDRENQQNIKYKN